MNNKSGSDPMTVRELANHYANQWRNNWAMNPKNVPQSMGGIEWLEGYYPKVEPFIELAIQKLCEEQKGEIERLKRFHTISICSAHRDFVKGCRACEAHVVMVPVEVEARHQELESQLATQTERVRVLEDALKESKQTLNLARGRFVPEDSMGTATILAIIDSVARIEQALKQDSLGDGK